MDAHGLIPLAQIPHAVILALVLCMVLVIATDAVHYIIPNSLNIIILLLYAATAFFLPLPYAGALLAAGIVLVFGAVLFSVGFMGGGDIKLLTVLTLWTGWGAVTINFLVMTALFGGALVIVILLLRWIVPPLLFAMAPERNVPQILARGQPVPYGLAIAAAFLQLLLTGAIPELGMPPSLM